MKEADIRKYAGLMQELGLTGLEITENNQVVRLERTPAATYNLPGAGTVPVVRAEETPADPEPADMVSVKSPLVGIFYSAPAENADPYVSIGDRVEKGTVLGLVETMKLMNEICAEEDGIISEICVTDGQVVEYGTQLFRIRR